MLAVLLISRRSLRAIHLAVSHDLGISGLVSSVRFQRFLNRPDPLPFAPATGDSVFAAVCTVHNTGIAISQQPVIRSGRPFARVSAPSSPPFRSLNHRDPCRIDQTAVDSLIFRAFCHISATADPIGVIFLRAASVASDLRLLRVSSRSVQPFRLRDDFFVPTAFQITSCVSGSSGASWCVLHCSWISGTYRL